MTVRHCATDCACRGRQADVWAQDALLVNPEHRRLYSSSAYFKTAVDTISQQLIPAMMDGLALHAEEVDRRLAEAYEVMMRAPVWGPLVVDPETFGMDQRMAPRKTL